MSSNSENKPPIIAIDGPAGSGKSTLAHQLASDYDLFFLDTGLLYRAVGRLMLDQGADPANEPRAVDAANALTPASLADDRLYSEAVGSAASKVAALPAVRAALLPVQRRLAKQSTKPGRGAVVVGRDIGSVVPAGQSFEIFYYGIARRACAKTHQRLAGARARA